MSSPALYDLSDWTTLRIAGSDAVKFLQNFCTNDIVGSEGCEAFFTNVKARVLAHGWLFKTWDAVWFFGTPGQGEALRTHLDRYVITEDVEFEDRTGGCEAMFLSGTAAKIEPFETKPCSVPVCYTRLDLLGEPGILYHTSAEHADALDSRRRYIASRLARRIRRPPHRSRPAPCGD